MTNQEPTVKFPDVEVELSGQDGNAFYIVGRVARALRRAGHPAAADEFSRDARACTSYDDVIGLAMRTVEVS